jgi:surface antigen
MNTFTLPHRPARQGIRSALLAACLALPVLASTPTSAQFVLNPMGTGMMPDSLTHDDVTAATEASAKLYTPEKVTVGAAERWSNPKSGNSGVVTLVRVFERDGMPCREILHRIKLAREGEQVYHFNRCRIATGEWKLVG